MVDVRFREVVIDCADPDVREDECRSIRDAGWSLLRREHEPRPQQPMHLEVSRPRDALVGLAAHSHRSTWAGAPAPAASAASLPSETLTASRSRRTCQLRTPALISIR